MSINRRRRGRSVSMGDGNFIGSTGQNKNMEAYIRYKFSCYLSKAMTCNIPFDDDFFELLGYILGGLKGVAKEVTNVLEGRLAERGTEEFKRAKHFLSERTLSKAKCEALREELQDCSEKRLARELEDAVSSYDGIARMCKDFILAHCTEKVREVAQPTLVKRFYERFKRYYVCSDESIEILEFLYLLKIVSIGERYFDNTMEITYQKNFHKFAELFDMSISTLQDSIFELQKAFLLEDISDYSNIDITPTVSFFWNTESEDAVRELLYNSLSGETLPLEAFNIKEKELRHIKGLLQHKGDDPVHILLYGLPGTGKTCFAHSLAKALKLEGWNIGSNNGQNRDSSRSYRGRAQSHITEMTRCSSLIASANMAKKQENVFLLVDEAERVLDTEMHAYDKSNDKAWLNAFLEESHIKCVWIVNKIHHVDQAVRRRFTYSVPFKALSKKQRSNSFLGIIKREKVSSFISKEEIAKLAKKYSAPVALITNAVQQAKFLGKNKEEFLGTVKQVIEAYELLSNNGFKFDKKKNKNNKEIDAHYSIDAITLNKNSGININSLMLKITRLNERLKSKEDFPPNAGTMLFYGPPGTGKTALAQYIAKSLKHKCQVVKASDLLSPLVGETEAKIASTFKKAEKNKAVLVFDEADSFLFPRADASRSWEITQVNEFLTALESYKGICICTSNFHEKMDMAAIRRFAFKVEFSYAEKEQVLELYSKLLEPLLMTPETQTSVNPKNPAMRQAKKQGTKQEVKEGMTQAIAQEMTAEEKRTLLSYTKLTPGDFAAVRSQYWLENENITHKELIRALGKEQKMKLDKDIKRMGF